MMVNEVSIDKAERELQKQVSNITTTNQQLLLTIKGASSSMRTLAEKQKDIFTELGTILSAEKSFTYRIDQVNSALERSSLLSSEYSALQSSLTLILHSLLKIQSLIATAVNNELDPSQIALADLKGLLPNNFLLSLKSARAEFGFDLTGYSVTYFLPQLSEPFFTYHIQQLPVYHNGSWFNIPKLENTVMINQIHEYLIPEQVNQLCSLIHGSYLCSQNSVVVRKRISPSCSLQLVLAQSHLGTNLTICKLDPVYFSEAQSYFSKGDKTYISNSLKEDQLHRTCPNTSEKSYPLHLGLNVFPLEPNCLYETAELVITGPKKLEVIPSSSQVDPELQLIKEYSHADFLITQSEDQTQELESLNELISKYKSDVNLNGKPVSELVSELERINSISGLANFTPIKFDLKTPDRATNWLAVVFWLTILTLVILFLIGLSCICPNSIGSACEATKDLLFKPFKKLRKSSTRMDYQVKPEEFELLGASSSMLTANLISHQGDLPWTCSTGPSGELTLTCQISDNNRPISLHYNFDRQAVLDDSLTVYPRLDCPSPRILSDFFNRVEKQPLPDTFLDKRGVICLKINPIIKFAGGHWSNSLTGKTIPGLRQPVTQL